MQNIGVTLIRKFFLFHLPLLRFGHGILIVYGYRLSNSNAVIQFWPTDTYSCPTVDTDLPTRHSQPVNTYCCNECRFLSPNINCAVLMQPTSYIHTCAHVQTDIYIYGTAGAHVILHRSTLRQNEHVAEGHVRWIQTKHL
jgi:hypothetical protein